MSQTPTVFITGTTSGIGLKTAHHMHQLGWHIFAGVLPGEDTTALTSGYTNRLSVIPIDVTKPDLITSATETIQSEVGDRGLDGLVNNAGMAVAGPMETMSLDDIRLQIEVNYIGQVAVTQAILPMIRQRATHIQSHMGRIINIGSMFGRGTVPFSGAYCSSKHAIEAFTDALRLELAPWKIKIVVIEPGVIKTPIWTKAGSWLENVLNKLTPAQKTLYADRLDRIHKITLQQTEIGIAPERVAKTIGRALTSRRPRARYVVGSDAWQLINAKRFLPESWQDWLILHRFNLK